MNERKNIENLFQDKFKNFEVEPNKIVWDNLKEKLEEKKKRRIVPFWFKFSGVAALLAIGIVLYNSDLKTNTIKNNNPVVNEYKDLEKNESEKNNTTTQEKKSVEAIANSNEVLNSISNNKSSTEIVTNNNKVEKSATFNTKNSIVNTSSEALKNQNKSKSKIEISNKSKISATSDSETLILNVKTETLKNTKSKIEISNTSENSVVNKSKINNSDLDKSNTINNNTNFNNKIFEDKLAVDKTLNNQNKIVNLNSKEVEVAQSKITSNDLINKIDSTKIAIVEPNALEELLKEKEKKLNAEPKINRWQVATNVAPIYFSSTNNGSPLDNKLASNDKSYATNFSYGVGVNYAVNKKFKIRTGLNRLAVDYDTNGIVYFENSSTASGKIANLNPNIIGSLITIESLTNVDSPFNKASLINKKEGSLNQKMGYIEFPLELSYRIVNKKVGVDFIGGMSTLYLNQNEIYLQSNEINMKIGEANNLNTFHFSGNLGLGFKYDFLKNFNAHLEPVFKYQLNTFSNNVGDFKPYVFGLYSGISYTF